ncbi:hypothetical protein D3C75_1382200 [compost metagenome]
MWERGLKCLTLARVFNVTPMNDRTMLEIVAEQSIESEDIRLLIRHSEEMVTLKM